MKTLLDTQIKDAAPQIFRRPFLSVESNTRMVQIATFFAIGPQIYVDGITVIDEVQKRPVGRISSKHMAIFWLSRLSPKKSITNNG